MRLLKLLLLLLLTLLTGCRFRASAEVLQISAEVGQPPTGEKLELDEDDGP